MKILNLKEFIALPVGAVFMKYEPCFFQELSVKGISVGTVDFLYSDLVAEILASDSGQEVDLLDEAQKDSSISVSLDLEIEGRDGLFNKEQLFAVYEQKEIDNLIDKLKSCKGI